MTMTYRKILDTAINVMVAAGELIKMGQHTSAGEMLVASAQGAREMAARLEAAVPQWADTEAAMDRMQATITRQGAEIDRKEAKIKELQRKLWQIRDAIKALPEEDQKEAAWKLKEMPNGA